MKNLWIVSYDISSPQRLRKVAKFLSGYGYRIQYSIFKVNVTDRDIEKMKFEIRKLTDEQDSVYFFRFCHSCAKKLDNINPEMKVFEEDVNFKIF